MSRLCSPLNFSRIPASREPRRRKTIKKGDISPTRQRGLSSLARRATRKYLTRQRDGTQGPIPQRCGPSPSLVVAPPSRYCSGHAFAVEKQAMHEPESLEEYAARMKVFTENRNNFPEDELA